MMKNQAPPQPNTEPGPRTAVILVDHGSKRVKANDMLLQVARLFEQHTPYGIVEPAHMELAEPSIATAFNRCVQRNAQRVVVSPYFLLPGKHWDRDIPALAAAAAKNHRGVSYLVTAPLGLDPLIVRVIQSRIDHCLAQAQGRGPACDVCRDTGPCQLLPVPD